MRVPLLLLGAALAAAACTDRPPVSPKHIAAGHARLLAAPVFQKIPTGGPTIALRNVHGVLRAANGDSVVVDALFQGDSAILTFDVVLIGTSATFTLDAVAFDVNGNEQFRLDHQPYTLHPGDNPDVPQPQLVYSARDAAVQALHVAPSSSTLNSGTTTPLSATGTASGGAVIGNVQVGWTSRDPSVATVDANGVVTAGANQGATYVVARMVSNLTDSALIRVHAPVDRVVVAPTNLTVARGATGALGAELRDAANHLIDDRAATWSTSDATVATVSSAGVVQAVAIGNATITATSEGKTATAAVRVISPVSRVDVAPTTLAFASFGETQTVTATIVPVTGASVAGIATTFTSSNATVATVDANGVVTARANGTATITAAADGISGTSAVTVRQVATSISVSPPSARVSALGDSRTFSATATDARGNAVVPITWTSSNPAVATVDASGVATGRSNGTVTITATAGDKTATASFTVAQSAVELGIFIDRRSMQVGNQANLTARLYDANGNEIPGAGAVYTSQNPSIASVNGNRVTANAPGTATIVGTAGSLTASTSVTVTPIVGGPPPAGGLNLSPASVEKLPNGTQQFTVTAGGNGPFTWTVNGVTGGNSTFGTITTTGLYTAPAAVPTPATFDVCATQATPTAQGCAHVTISAVPTSGADVIVFNDVNMFDNVSSLDVNNQKMYVNLVNYTGPGARATQTSVMFYFGHGSAWNSGSVTARSYMIGAGFSVTDFAGDLSTIPASYKVLFLWLPTTQFSVSEINAMKQFSADGGRIVFIGEHAQFYGAGITIENNFLQKMGAQMTNTGGAFDCSGDDGFAGFPVLPANRLQPHQVTTGMSGLTLACASELVPGPNDFVLFRSFNGAHVLGAVAKIDVTPLSSLRAGFSLQSETQEKPRMTSTPTAWTDPARRAPGTFSRRP